ncbi:MAG: DUF87 domain-containing protein [Candidatus Diapherotrites archaeon]
MTKNEEIGTVISTPDGPSPSALDFVVYSGTLHRGMFVELDYAEGTLVALVTDVVKTNRYFERVESVKEFESSGTKLFEQFPTHEWEFLLAKTRPLGVYNKGMIKRSSFPPSPGAKVRVASKETLENFLGLDLEKGLMLGEIEHHDVSVKLNMSRLFQKHLAILAMSGAGKCTSFDAEILLENKVQVKIGELVDSILEKNKRVEDGVEFWEGDLDLKTYSFNGEKIVPAEVKGVYRRKSPHELIKVTTRSGRILKVTPEHLIPMFSGSIEWLHAKDLVKKNYLIFPRINWSGSEQVMDFSSVVGEKTIVRGGFAESKKSGKKVRLLQSVDKDFVRLFAYLLAEGHNTCGSQIWFSNEDEFVRKDFSKLVFDKFGSRVSVAKHGGDLIFYNKLLAQALSKKGFTNSSWTKFVPPEILRSRREVLLSFLSVFIDCDGHINKSKSELEITLASKKLIFGIEEILTKLGIVSFRGIKKTDGKVYQRLFVRGAELKKLKDLDLLIGYKKKALEKWIASKNNPNVDVVPNLHSHLFELLSLLRMPQPQAESSGINNYLYRRDNPSRENLSVLISIFERRCVEVEKATEDAYTLYKSIPKVSEEDALVVVQEAYSSGLDFNKISSGSGVSKTTARRVVRGITSPKSSVFSLAKNISQSRYAEFGFVENFDGNSALTSIKEICERLGHETQTFCVSNGVYKNFLYSHSKDRGVADHSIVLKLSESLCEIARKSEKNLGLAKGIIFDLKKAIDLNAFFDEIVKVEKVPSENEFVYDLSVDNSSFVANNLLIHNSYLTSVLFEELLERKKEDGRLALIVMDTHGEYRNFAEPVKDSKSKDFSSKTRFVKASEISIGVPKLSIGMLSIMIPGLSGPQKRDLARVLEKLRREMKDGLGPYDFGAVKSEIFKDEEMKESTKLALTGWIISLEQLKLFGKTDNPSINDLVKPGQLTIVDLSDVIEMKKKQIIVSYFASKLFFERRQKRIAPFSLVLEEAHQYCPEGTSKEGAISRGIIETIAREGRKFGASICLISQRPINLSTTALSQCGTHIILRVTNPYDLDHIGKSSEGLDRRSLDMITSLRTGEALLVGEAVNYPTFFKVRKRTSQDSIHEKSLEEASVEFEEIKEASQKDIEDLM